MSGVPRDIKTFKEFWPFYLREHLNPTSRRLHFTGTFCVIAVGVTAVVLRQWLLLLAMPVCGYAFAWIGHFVFERNRPATFIYPFFSLRADFKMFFKILNGTLGEDLAKLKSDA